MITRARYSYFLSISVAIAALAAAYFAIGLWWAVPLLFVTALVWLWGDRKGRTWIGSLGFLILMLMATVGMMLSISPVLAILSFTAGLVGWDIGRFNDYFDKVTWAKDSGLIERRYRKRVLTVALAGGIVAIGATLIQVNFGFAIALLLGLLSVVGFSRAMVFLRQERA